MPFVFVLVEDRLDLRSSMMRWKSGLKVLSSVPMNLIMAFRKLDTCEMTSRITGYVACGNRINVGIDI